MSVLTRPEDLVLVNIDENTAATHAIVDLAAGQTITVYEVYLVAAGTTDVTFKTATTTVIGPIGMKTGDVLHIPASTVMPFMRCVKGEAFQITLSAGERISGWARYTQR